VPYLRPLALAVLLLASVPALAQGTSEQRAACTPDVLRLCAADIPDVGRITACLKRERARVGLACRHAMGGDVTATGSIGKRQDRRPAE
jgi:hypothetical protein